MLLPFWPCRRLGPASPGMADRVIPMPERRRGPLRSTVARGSGNALIIHPRRELDRQAQAFAEGLAHDRQHTPVVLDLPPEPKASELESLVRLLQRRSGSFRLVPARGSGRFACTMAQWLADRLHRVVLAPDGTLIPAGGGGLFVPPGQGLGWLRHQPGRQALPDSRRFPKPQWEYSTPDRPTPLGLHLTTEPIPGGVWLRSVDAEPGEERRQQLVDRVIADSELLAVVLGVPGAAPLPLEAVSAFWENLAPSIRPRVRFVPYGPVAVAEGALGQALANLLAHQVVLYNGFPAVGRAGGTLEVHTLREDGPLGWRPFASELGYSPVAGAVGVPCPPLPLGCRAPVPGLAEIGPGVYRYEPDAVLEIVQSGLWLRPLEDPEDADAVRLTPADPQHATILFDESTPRTAERMRTLAHEVLEQLDLATRRLSLVLPASRVAGRRVVWDDGYDRRAPVTPAPNIDAIWRSSAPNGPSAAADPTTVANPTASPWPTAAPGSIENPWAAPSRRLDEVGYPPGAEQAAVAHGPALDSEMDASPPVSHPPATTSSAVVVAAHMVGREGPPWVSGEEAIEPTRMPDTPLVHGTKAASAPGPEIRLKSEPIPLAAALEPPTPASGTAPQTGLPTASVAVGGTALSAGAGPPHGGDLRDLLGEPVAATPMANHQAAGGEEDPATSGRSLHRPDTDGYKPSPTATREVTPVHNGDEPRTEEPGVRVQPVPGPAVCVMPPEGGIDRERAWLRGHLGKRYDAAVGSVARIMSESPGLRVGDGVSGARDDLVAVWVYLSGTAGPVDEPIRRGEDGPHVSLARCVASGLRRLPSYRGAVVLRAALGDEERAWYREGLVVPDWGFVSALTTARSGLPGNTDFLIWSRTARRTALMETEVPDRVLFLPGTRFKVLRVASGDRYQLLLRELAPSENTMGGPPRSEHSSLDDVALTGLETAAVTVREARAGEPLPRSYAWFFSAPPGLIVSAPLGRVSTHATEGVPPNEDEGTA